MKIFLLGSLLILSTALACSGDRPSRKNLGGGGAGTGSTPISGEGANTTTNGGDNPNSLSLTAGSTARLLDGKALTIIYSRVFPRSAYGFEQCKNSNFPELSDCWDTMFEPRERPFMGSIDLYTLEFNRGPQNIRPASDLTLNYTRTLRVALSRECDAFVNREYEALLEGKEAANFLIKGPKPSSESIDEFFRRILGIEGSGLAVNIAAADYVAAFDAYTAGKSDPDTLKRAYYGLCIAVAMDPQIFFY